MLTLCLITPGDLAILLGRCRYHTGVQPGRVVRHGYCDAAKVGEAERFCRHVRFTVMGTVDTTFFVVLAGQGYDTGLG